MDALHLVWLSLLLCLLTLSATTLLDRFRGYRERICSLEKNIRHMELKMIESFELIRSPCDRCATKEAKARFEAHLREKFGEAEAEAS